MSDLEIRDVRPEDAQELADLINAIIERGGTTAFQQPFTAEALRDAYLIGPHMISAVVAVDPASGRLEGFQIIGDFGEVLPDGVADIGTYARIDGNQRGVGRALFAATCDKARAAGITALNATIRADNVGGQTYYAKMGFIDHAVKPPVPLADGSSVGRICKRYSLDG